MKYTDIFALGLAAFIGFTSCIDEDYTGTEGTQGSNGIQFNATTTETKTVYGSQQTDKSWPVYWEANDKIRIYCEEAETGKQADYVVIPTSANSATGTITLAAGSAALQWGGSSDMHNFYAVYPNTVTVSDGVVAFPINRNQKAFVATTDGKTQDIVAKPDMTNQYMVAKTSTTPIDQAVGLAFEPIMTTLDIVITAATVNMNVKGSARITGISISSTMLNNSNASRETFYYDLRNGVENGAITANGATSSGTATTMTEQTFVNLVDANGNATYVDLAQGHTLTMTVFLPPMSIEAAKNMKRQVKVRVHATGNTELVASLKTNDSGTANWTTQLTPGTKRKVKLPALPTDTQISGNNWITPLDGDIYVSQMSIPGAHDAATGEDMTTIVGDLFASTQEQTLQTQWNLGVRAFDLRPAIYDKLNNIDLPDWLGGPQGYDDDELWLYHGVTRVNVSWTSAMNTIKANLTENPGEFAIVLFRHEDESTLGKSTDSNYFNTHMTNYINANKNWIVDWKPDLTIDECRGKIILISRFSGTWSYGCFTGWNHEAAGAVTTLRNADGSKSATMYVQDYYNPSSHDAKWQAIKTYLEITKTFHTDASKLNHWAINHASGYVGSSTSSTYRNNAAAHNPALISYLTSSTWEGSTGIMMFDYAGASLSNGLLTGNVEVQGDVALQTIIDNNYKYRMKRKGE